MDSTQGKNVHINFRDSFSTDVLDEAKSIINDEKFRFENTDKQRIDLTHLKTYAIDDESSYEIDDAISLQKKDGYQVIWVHIADPCRVISPEGLLEKEARKEKEYEYH